MRFITWSSCSGMACVACRWYCNIHDSDVIPVSPNAPEAKQATTAIPRTKAAGTRTGLKMKKRGVVIARPMREPIKVTPESARSPPLIGRRVTITSALELEGTFCSCRSCGCIWTWCIGERSAIDDDSRWISEEIIKKMRETKGGQELAIKCFEEEKRQQVGDT